MPIAPSAGAYEVGIAKQVAEGTVPTIATYSMPVLSGRPRPVQSTSRVEVTDAASIVGDEYKNPDEHWEADITVPAFAAPLGALLQSLWPIDTISGAGPLYTHTFTGLGTTGPWVAMYDDFTNATKKGTYEAGKCAGMTFTCTEAGGPLQVGYRAVGKRPTDTTYTVTTAASLADGYFTAVGAVMQFDEDTATAVTHTNIQQFSVNVDQPVNALATVNGTSVSNLGMTRLTPSMTMSLYWENWDAYKNTFYGTVAGTTPVSTFASGKVILNFVHTTQPTWTFILTMDKVWLRVTPPDPDPGGAPLTMAVEGSILKPASGDHVKPVLSNGVTPAY
jgi:hypothetical protein